MGRLVAPDHQFLPCWCPLHVLVTFRATTLILSTGEQVHKCFLGIPMDVRMPGNARTRLFHLYGHTPLVYLNLPLSWYREVVCHLCTSCLSACHCTIFFILMSPGITPPTSWLGGTVISMLSSGSSPSSRMSNIKAFSAEMSILFNVITYYLHFLYAWWFLPGILYACGAGTCT